LGYHALEPYLDKAIGFRSPGFHIEMKKDYFRVLVATFEDAQGLLLRLPLRHTERVALKGFALSIKKGTLWSDVGPKRDALRKSIDDAVESFTKQAEQQYLKTHPPRSNPVLCLLQSSIRQSGQDEHVEKQLESLRMYLAVHVEERCLVDEPCVMLCKGCDEQNIVSILVHESIHHALLWMSDDFLNPLDPLDSIVPSMNRRGFREEGFLLYG
jgi:hypothetical protein